MYFQVAHTGQSKCIQINTVHTVKTIGVWSPEPVYRADRLAIHAFLAHLHKKKIPTKNRWFLLVSHCRDGSEGFLQMSLSLAHKCPRIQNFEHTRSSEGTLSAGQRPPWLHGLAHAVEQGGDWWSPILLSISRFSNSQPSTSLERSQTWQETRGWRPRAPLRDSTRQSPWRSAYTHSALGNPMGT